MSSLIKRHDHGAPLRVHNVYGHQYHYPVILYGVPSNADNKIGHHLRVSPLVVMPYVKPHGSMPGRVPSLENDSCHSA